MSWIVGRLQWMKRARSRRVIAVAALMVAAAVVAQVADPAIPEDELNQLVDGTGFDTRPPLGGPGQFGASAESPVALGSLKTNYSQADVAINGPFGGLSLTRSASFGINTWTVGKYQTHHGAPFGYARGANNFIRLNWWHNFHSYIEERLVPGKCPEPPYLCPENDRTYWDVHGGPAGVVKSFEVCETYGCFAGSKSEQDLKLQFLENHGFVVHAPDGRYYYQNGNLSYIESLQYDEEECPNEHAEDAGTDAVASCHRRRVRLHYEVLTECAVGAPEDIAKTVGVTSPRLRSVVAGNGAKLVFNYQRLPSQIPDMLGTRTHECVLRSVDLVGRDGTVESSVVEYEYATAPSPDGGAPQPVAGHLSKVKWPDRDGGPVTGSTMEYDYQPGDGGIWSVKRDGVLVAHQVLNSLGVVVEDSNGTGTQYQVTTSGNNCASGVFAPVVCLRQEQHFATSGRTTGDGTGNTATQVTQTFASRLSGKGPVGDQGPVVTGARTVAQCGGSDCLATEPATTEFGASWSVGELSLDSLDTRVVDVAAMARHPNDAYTVYTHRIAPTNAIAGYSPFVLPPAELQKVVQGASSYADGGTDALLTTDFTYVYGGISRDPLKRAYEQLMDTASSPSSFSDEDSSLKSVTLKKYDSFTNRLKSSIRTGYTLEFSPEEHTWARKHRAVGTFSFTYDVCAGQATTDPQGRVRTVMGPCDVDVGNASTATSCSGSASVPLTTYEYWSASEISDRAGRIKATRTYPDGCGSTPIVSAYDDYDARGRLKQTTDANGTITRYEYEGNHLVRMIRAAGDPQMEAVTEYGYDNGVSHGDYIRHPDGRYEVLCYRINTTAGQGCVGGTLTSLLQWKASSGYPAGFLHSERIDYSYHLGKLRSETVRDAANLIRRTRYYEGDPLDRQTYQSWGAANPAPPADSRYSQTSLFDPQGNQVGLGLPYQQADAAPAPLCGGFDPNSIGSGSQAQPTSPHCKAFAYDRLNRLAGVLEPVDTSSATGEAVKMCLSYDNAGNLRGVRQGCPRGAGPASDCSQCSQPLLEYRHDDFGNLVQVDVPWGTGTQASSGDPAGPGRYRYQYDRAGNLIVKQTPTMAASAEPQWIENSYDKLGRILKSEAVDCHAPTADCRETLFWYSYDASVSPPWGCPGYAASRPARAMGRVQVVTDSFGDTWYQYDAHGNTIGMFRVRSMPNIAARTLLCSETRGKDSPVHQRFYDHAGRLVNEGYPGGRSTWYRYYEGHTGNSHRVAALDVTIWNGTAFSDLIRVADEVQWEPFGGLRSYVLTAPKAPAGAQKARVEYHMGGLNQPLSNCGSTAFVGSLDMTGRLGGLTVSKVESGGVLGGIFKRAYTWKADQLLQEDTCLLESGNVPPVSVKYADAVSGVPGYDARLQLRRAHKVSNSSVNTGGSFLNREYEVDTRGNRTGDIQDGVRFSAEYQGGGARVDLMTARYLDSVSCNGQACPPRLSVTQRYEYDADGRVARVSGYKRRIDSVSSPFYSMELDAATNGRNAAVGAVYRLVTDGPGRIYEYFYDANGRRRLKRYAQGALQDEYFYDGTQLMEDWGNTGLDSSTTDSMRDEYIWLAGRPIAFFKSRVTHNQQRIEDFVGDCPRNGEPAPCGLYFPITDGLGKPVLLLDSHRRIAGAADYDPFGHVNRTTLSGESPAFLPGVNEVLATVQVPASSPLVTQMRIRYSILDVHDGSGVYLANSSGTQLDDINEQSTLIEDETSWGAISGWIELVSGGVQVRFQASAIVSALQDVSLKAAEYRRFEPGAAPVWTPLRFPGQYHDVETDFFENWNRFYDPETGRYLGPDWLMLDPEVLLKEARSGQAMFAYVYARNNPVAYVDPLGLLEMTTSLLAEADQRALEIVDDLIKRRALKQGEEMSLDPSKEVVVPIVGKFDPETKQWGAKAGNATQEGCVKSSCPSLAGTSLILASVHDHFPRNDAASGKPSSVDINAANKVVIYVYTHSYDGKRDAELYRMRPNNQRIDRYDKERKAFVDSGLRWDQLK